jgi:hypothetical protein
VGAREALNQLAPHIYLVAGNAFRAMVREGTSQSLVINGESGAGGMRGCAQLARGNGAVGCNSQWFQYKQGFKQVIV